MISGNDFIDEDTPPDNDIYVVFNSYDKALEFELPKLNGKKWYRVIDTYMIHGHDFLDIPLEVHGKKYKVMDRSAIVLISK